MASIASATFYASRFSLTVVLGTSPTFSRKHEQNVDVKPVKPTSGNRIPPNPAKKFLRTKVLEYTTCWALYNFANPDPCVPWYF